MQYSKTKFKSLLNMFGLTRVFKRVSIRTLIICLKVLTNHKHASNITGYRYYV